MFGVACRPGMGSLFWYLLLEPPKWIQIYANCLGIFISNKEEMVDEVKWNHIIIVI